MWRDPAAVLERTLLQLVDAARDTEFGLAHGFETIWSVREYQQRVPIREYHELRPCLQQALRGDRSILWPGHPVDWIRTSGTTGAAKIIPLTREAASSLRKVAADVFVVSVERAGGDQVLGGPMLMLGGRAALQPIGVAGRVGDLSNWGEVACFSRGVCSMG